MPSPSSARVANASLTASSDPSRSRRWITTGLPGPPGDLDLGREGAALVVGLGAVAVEVEPGLARPRPRSSAPAELLDRLGGRLVEAVGAVRVPADAGEHLLVLLRRGDRAGVRVLARGRP